jgi:hypothetical protein
MVKSLLTTSRLGKHCALLNVLSQDAVLLILHAGGAEVAARIGWLSAAFI